MTVAFNKFNTTVQYFLNGGGLNFSSDVCKLMLTNTAPVATNTTYASISANELASGAGAFSFSGHTATDGIRMSAAAGAFAFTGTAATLAESGIYILTGTSGAFSFIGSPATLTNSGGGGSGHPGLSNGAGISNGHGMSNGPGLSYGSGLA